jgi:hypothetical protein
MKFSERQRIIADSRAKQVVLQWEIRTRRICEERLIILARRAFGRTPTVEELDAWQRSPDGADAILEVMRSINADPAMDFCFPRVPKSATSHWPTATKWRGEKV